MASGADFVGDSPIFPRFSPVDSRASVHRLFTFDTRGCTGSIALVE